MGLFQRKRKKHNNLDDDKRQLALEKRRANAELRKAQDRAEIERIKAETQLEQLRLQREQLELQQEIEEMTGYDEEDEEQDSNPLNQVLSMFAMQMMNQSKGVNQMPSPESFNNVPSTTISLSDEAIDEAVKRIPKKYRLLFKKVPDGMVKEIFHYVKSCDDDTLNRFVQKAKSI